MTQHTQGRLDYDIDSTIIYSGNTEVAKMFNPQMSNDGWRTAVSNARRMVACWNACEGMSTDALEANTVLSVLTYQRAKWNLERDELLEALKRIAGASMSMYANRGHMLADAREIAQTAIAKADAA